LKKRLAPYNNVKVIETGLERRYFTKHGLHLNTSGKERIAHELAITVRNFLKKEKLSPISLYWKEDTLFSELNGNESHTCSNNPTTDPQSHLPTSEQCKRNSVSEESTQALKCEEGEIGWLEPGNEATSLPRTNLGESKTRNSNHHKQEPITRSSDFLW
jgi:hypothetical protein